MIHRAGLGHKPRNMCRLQASGGGVLSVLCGWGALCRQSTEERLKLANYVHTWRVQYVADRLLKQQPPNFAWFQKQVYLKPLVVTPQGHVVVLLKVSCTLNHEVCLQRGA
eukprot:GHUV01027744.1.p1 GENE.GHUV01027744.1~~GHUV01027744.1.p1  ORF type:complete len:110 (-),score=22.09 GHUV01027744.1:619-948(-)